MTAKMASILAERSLISRTRLVTGLVFEIVERPVALEMSGQVPLRIREQVSQISTSFPGYNWMDHRNIGVQISIAINRWRS